jgi:HAE1 family hydrophobic/amphiphilic exporter-1
VQQIGNALRPFVAGDTVSHWLASDGQNYDVNVQLPKSGRQKVADLADLSLASSKLDANGKPVMMPLRQVVEFVPSSSPQVLKRQALQRRVAMYAGVRAARRRRRRRCAEGHEGNRPAARRALRRGRQCAADG